MVIGAVAVPSHVVSIHNKNIRELKQRHGLPEFLEMKWTKVSPAKLTAYRALVDYFFEHPDMMFRGVAVVHKPAFDKHKDFQAYGLWHNEMYNSLLKKYAVGDERCRNHEVVRHVPECHSVRAGGNGITGDCANGGALDMIGNVVSGAAFVIRNSRWGDNFQDMKAG